MHNKFFNLLTNGLAVYTLFYKAILTKGGFKSEDTGEIFR